MSWTRRDFFFAYVCVGQKSTRPASGFWRKVTHKTTGSLNLFCLTPALTDFPQIWISLLIWQALKGHWPTSSNDSRAHLRNWRTNNFRTIIWPDWGQFLLLVLCNNCYPYSVGSKSSFTEINRDKFHFMRTYCYLHW